MKKVTMVKTFVCLAVGLPMLGTAAPLYCQVPTSYTELNSKGQKADSTPISDRTILFEVTLISGRTAKLRIKEGAMAKVGDLDKGYAFALVPSIKDMTKQSVSFTVYRLTQDKDGNEFIRQVDKVETDLLGTVAVNCEPSFQLRVIATEEPKSQAKVQVTTP